MAHGWPSWLGRGSDALENFRASHSCHAAVWQRVCRDPSRDKGRRADKASRPDRGRSAICRPVPRGLEHDPRAANTPYQIVGNSLAGARRTAHENSGEISRGGIDCQDLQQRASLTLPKGWEQALRGSGSSGGEKKKQSRNTDDRRTNTRSSPRSQGLGRVQCAILSQK